MKEFLKRPFSIVFNILNVSVLNYSEARSKALHLLNNKKPQFPPDVYYIRRNPEVLKTFLNHKEHITNLQKEQSPAQRISYQMFQLTDADKDILNRQNIV